MDKFIILSEGRTGSNLLYTYLNSHSKIKCFGEALKLPTLKKQNISYIKQRNKIFAQGSEPVKGCKIFYTHLTPKQWKWYKDNNIRIIHLMRRNRLKKFVSLLIAEKHRIWFMKKRQNKKIPLSQKCVKIDLVRLKKDIARGEHFEKWAKDYFHSNPYIEVYYEDLVKNPKQELKKLQKFLGVPIQRLKTCSLKQNPEKVKDLVINYNEVLNELRTFKNGKYLKIHLKSGE